MLQDRLGSFLSGKTRNFFIALWKRKGQGDSATPKFPLTRAHHIAPKQTFLGVCHAFLPHEPTRNDCVTNP